MKKHNKQSRKSQRKKRRLDNERGFQLFCNELDEYLLAQGPRLFDDIYYDESVPLKINRSRHDKG